MLKLAIKIILALLVVVVVCGVLFSRSDTRAQRDLEATRRLLRQQGFKIDLSEFNLSTPPDVSRRAALIATTTWAAMTNQTLRSGPMLGELPALMQPVGADSAVVVWKLAKLSSQRSADGWPYLRWVLNTNRLRLDAAAGAAVSGPIRFEPLGSSKRNPLLPYLADLKNLVITFGTRTVLALHDGDKETAWTNLLASTCLVTAYEPEPMDISHLVRFSCAAVAFNSLWNALQSSHWTDAQLADLQHRWEGVEFWNGLPNTAAYSRASMAATCEVERSEGVRLFASLGDTFRSPRYAWTALSVYRQRLHYLHQGSYEDERALQLYFRDREVELRHAITLPTWNDMRGAASVTNPPAFRSKYSSRSVALMNTRLIGLRFQNQGQGLLARAADAETRRRLIVTALALERYRARHGSYPHALLALVPELLKDLPVDFMDGNPLRYRLTSDGHFILYSIGLDCVDNGGQMARRRGPWAPGEDPPVMGIPQASDLVWPRPASAEEVEVLEQKDRQIAAEQRERSEQMQSAAQWKHAAWRQANVETILAASPPPITNQPAYKGRPLAEVLGNLPGAGPNKPTLASLLTLKPVITGAEPEIATFELPINFDVLTNVGALHLFVDLTADQESDAGCEAEAFECRRGPNGNCLLTWSTIYESPGKHALQPGLFIEDSDDSENNLIGAPTPYAVSNLCQFSTTSAAFDPAFGPTLRAHLSEPRGDYVLEIKSPAGGVVKTIPGTTTNGIMTIHWDLKDDRGNTCTNQSFDTVFHIRLSSGRSQTLKGP